MRATQHFHRGLLLGMTQWKEKKFRETHWNIFGVFSFSWRKQIKERRKTKTRKTIYTGKLPTRKRRTRKSFWGFLLNTTLTKLERKTKKKQEIFFGFFQSFSNTQKEREKINLAWIIQWKSVNTDNWNEMCEHECNVDGNMYSPKLRILA